MDPYSLGNRELLSLALRVLLLTLLQRGADLAPISDDRCCLGCFLLGTSAVVYDIWECQRCYRRACNYTHRSSILGTKLVAQLIQHHNLNKVLLAIEMSYSKFQTYYLPIFHAMNTAEDVRKVRIRQFHDEMHIAQWRA
jgi:hypothetical protein